MAETVVSSKEMEQSFKEYSVAEFFKKNRQMLGYSGKIRSLTTIVHEFVTNSLDSCEDAKILPEIHVEVSELPNKHFKVIVEDNGIGIPKSRIGQALGKLLAGTKFHQRMQKRGQQGIGACMRADTLVPLADGRILPIKKIVDDNMVGSEIFAFDTLSQKMVPAKISQCIRVVNPEFIKVGTTRGREIYLTPENPVLTVRKGALEWTPANCLQLGEKIAAAKSALRNATISKHALRQIVTATSGLLQEQLKTSAESEAKWLSVTGIEKISNPDEFVYDLEVEQHHNFVANGIIVHNSYATLFAQITTGKPTHVKTGIGDGMVYECDLTVDIKRNEPSITDMKEYRGKFQGVRIESEYAEVDYNRSEYSVYEYLRRTALANPHSQLTLIEPNKEITVFPRASKELPKKAKKILPHPLGITTSDLMDMAGATNGRKISSFLTADFSRVSADKVKEIQAMIPHVNLERSPRALQWSEAEELVKTFQQVKWISPETDALQPIGEAQIVKSLKNLLQPEKLSVVERKPKVFRGGIPFSVEVAIAYGGKAGAMTGDTKKGEVLRFANRVPLLFDAGNCATMEAIKTIDWARYDLKEWETMPVSVFINFVSVYVPYTGAGKLAISAEEDIVNEIRMAIMEAARDISVYLHGILKAEDQERRRQIFFKYIKEVAQALEEVTGRKAALLEAKLRKIAEKRTALMEAEDEQAEKELEAIEEESEKEIEAEG